jgi:hypothetical protein
VSKEQEVWCVMYCDYSGTKNKTDRSRLVSNNDLILDAKMLNANLPTVALHSAAFKKISVKYCEGENFKEHWFCTEVICE